MENYEYSLDFSPEAQNDLLEISSRFVMFGSKNGAIRITNKLFKAAEQIRFMPYIGAVISDSRLAKAGFRMFVVEKYLMLYKVFEDDKSVLIYRIVNGKTDYPTLMNRLYN